MFSLQKSVFTLFLSFFVIQWTVSENRRGRQLDLDAIIEGRLSNHVIGERQSRTLSNKTDGNTTNSNILNSIGKNSKLLDEETILKKHSSYVPHYVSDSKLLNSDEHQKSTKILNQLPSTSAIHEENVNEKALYMQPISYFNGIYPITEDKILSVLINQAASNIMNNQQSIDLTTAHSNSSPIYLSSADRPIINSASAPSITSSMNSFLNISANKKNPFSSISSSIQGLAASMFPNRLTNKFIKRKQSGQSIENNQIDFASFATECKCVPIYMCLNGYMIKNEANTALPINRFDQNKVTNTYEPSITELVENSASPQFSQYQDAALLKASRENLPVHQNMQEMLMTVTKLGQNGYPSIANIQPVYSNKFNNAYNSPTTLPVKINKRVLQNELTDHKKSQDTEHSEVEKPIDERSFNKLQKTDSNNQTENLQKNLEYEALTKMFDSRFAPQAVSMLTVNDQQQQNCGMFRTCCPILSQQDLLLAQHFQIQQTQLNAAIQSSPSTPVFAFENFQPTFINSQPASVIPINQQSPILDSSSFPAQSSQNNFIYQPVYQPESSILANSNSLSLDGSLITDKQTLASNRPNLAIPSLLLKSKNQMLNNRIVSNSMINNPTVSNNQMTNNQMDQFTPFNKWLQKDKIIYQQTPNLFSQPPLSSYLLTKQNYQARNPTNQQSNDQMNSDENENFYLNLTSRRKKTNINQQCGRMPKLVFNEKVQTYPSQEFSDYPWYGKLLQKLDDGQFIFICGVTLISDRWLLTKSHCLKKNANSELKIRIGEYDDNESSKNNSYQFVERNVERIIRHPNYDSSTHHNDISLILIEPIDLTTYRHIIPVCIASNGENFANRKCVFSSFSKNRFEKLSQTVRQNVELSVLDHSKCATQLQEIRLDISFVPDKEFICAISDSDSRICPGDAGAVLVCNEIISGENIWKAIGFISSNIGCGQTIPYIFSNLSYYESWIDNTINLSDNDNIFH